MRTGNKSAASRSCSPFVQAEPDAEEVTLWRQVVRQAMLDATGSVNDSDPKVRAKAYRIRNQAREWLIADEDDFAEVCSLARLDPAAVRDRANVLAERRWLGFSHRQYSIAESIRDGAAA